MKSRRVGTSARYLFYFCSAMEKKLSIVIPVYNRGAVVGRTLRSIAAQTYRPLKVVLVDNASADDTAAVLRAWRAEVSAPDFEVEVLAETTPGAAAARNAGLARVDTPWVMFFDSDDTMRPSHCARAMEAAAPGIDIIGWNVNISLPGGQRLGRFAGKNRHFDNLFHGGFATLRWCVRTETVRRVGAWNEHVAIWDDIELGTRLIEAGAVIKHLDGEPTVDVEFSDASISNEPWPTRFDRIEAVMSTIEANLPPRRKCYASVKLALAAGEAMRESRDTAVRRKAMQIYHTALSRTAGRRQRLLLRLAFNYIRCIPRGAVALLSVFMK